ncbi:hypothetical protein KCP71_21950 [Salmonella enterica subsp. enterica]|nr:hypothetical protein KCP71_21950 [Salmonella enterica subsp. enterica]
MRRRFNHPECWALKKCRSRYLAPMGDDGAHRSGKSLSADGNKDGEYME